MTPFVAVWHWLLQVTGNASPGTRWNLAWAGFLSAGVISTGVIHRIREKQCHTKWCPRIAQHSVKTGHRVCRRCVAKHPDELDLHPIHEANQ